MTTNWQRARSPEQKEERTEAILKAAAELIDQDGLDGTGLNAIARKAGISKGNMYRYFESREAVLMQLLVVENQQCSEALAAGFQPLEGSNNAEAVAKVIAEAMSNRSRYWLLLGALAGILEHNVSSDTIAQFKTDLQTAFTPSLMVLHAAVPCLTIETLYDYMAFLTMAGGGIWPHTHPSPAAKEVIDRPEFSAFKFDFQDTMQRNAEALLKGLIAQAEQ